jgi:Tol biopolymer transport system component
MKRILLSILIVFVVVAALTWTLPVGSGLMLNTDSTMEVSRAVAAGTPSLRLEQAQSWGPNRGSMLDRLQGVTRQRVVFAAYANQELNRDIYAGDVRLNAAGHFVGLDGLTNLTATPDGDETALAAGGERLAYATRISGRFQLVTVLSLESAERIVLVLAKPADDVSVYWDVSGRVAIVAGGSPVARVDAASRIVDPPDAPLRLLVQTEGELALLPRVVNAVRQQPWMGPEKIAFLENVYFFLVDVWDRATYRAPAELVALATQAPAPGVSPSPPADVEATPMPAMVTPIVPSPVGAPVVTPAVWEVPSVNPNRVAAMPADLGMPHHSVYPDPNRPFAKAEVIALDPLRFDFHLVAGTAEPRSTTGLVGTGVIPDDEATRRGLVAAFNGGWAAMHGNYGLMIDRQVFLPAKNGVATLAWYADGSLRLGVWGRGIQPSADIVSYRQNCLPLIENGVISPELGKLSLWGLSISDEAVIYRSGLGQSRDGRLVYVAGNALSALTLARVLSEAGAYNAMQLDIDDFHVAFITYRQVAGKDGKVQVVGTKLRPDMQGFDGHFLQPFALDFFYVTRRLAQAPLAPVVATATVVPAPGSRPSSLPPLPPMPGRIAFQSSRDGNWEIYTMQADGSSESRLTNSAADDLYPAWSPDGSRLAFTSGRDGNWEIYTMTADGAGQVRLTTDASNDWYPAWSPDGSRIAFQTDREGNAEIYAIPSLGGVATRLTQYKGNNERPTWSPDGQRLAFDSDLLEYGTVSAGIDLYVLQVGSSVTPTRLLRNAEYPAWSPDGSRIAYHAQGYGAWDIYTMRADGSGVNRITSYPADNRYPAWSPDGRWIAFSSNRDGQWEVYATLSDGTGPSYRLTYGGGVHPAWGQ